MKLINRKAVKDFTLKLDRDRYVNIQSYRRTRVSEKFFETCEMYLETFIRQQVSNRVNGKGTKTI